jgi:parallel beta-helix repeat protein
MRKAKVRIAVAAISSVVAMSYAGVAQGAHVSCDSTITVDTTLDSDLQCQHRGISIGAPDVTLDLNGHVIDGTRPEGNQSTGVFVLLRPGTEIGFENATVTNGTIRGFGDNITLWGDGHRVTDLILENPTFTNVEGFRGKGVAISRNVMRGGNRHVSIIDSDLAVIVRNDLSGDVDFGISSSGSGTLVAANRVTGSTFGILVSQGTGHRLVRNYVQTSFVSMGTNTTSAPVIKGNTLLGGGLNVLDTGDAVIRHNALRGDGLGHGINMFRSTNGLLAGNSVSGFIDGLRVESAASRNNVVKGNDLFSNVRDGLLVDSGASDTSIAKNRAQGNGDDGFDVRVAGTTLKKNRANANGDLGIDAAVGVIDGGGNKARDNGNPAQCAGVDCR